MLRIPMLSLEPANDLKRFIMRTYSKRTKDAKTTCEIADPMLISEPEKQEVRAMVIEMRTPLKQATDQVSCSLDDEVVILNLESSLYFGLDEVAACIWEAMREPATPSEICQKVMDRFDVQEEQCLSDVLSFLEKLAEASLIQAHSEK